MKATYALTLWLLLTLVTGCGTSPVADDLGQREANKLVAVLGENGIDATTEKARGAKGRYSVVVSSGDFASAAALLTKLGLPAERGASFAELMVPSGILPASADVENMRMDRAIAAEVEQLLLGYSGVSAVSVVVRSHAVPAGASSSVSIVAQTKQGVPFDQIQAREVVARAVPGVKDGDISFTVSETRHGVSCPQSASAPLVPFLRYWRVPASEYNSLAYLLIGLMSFVAFLTGVGGYIYGQYEATKAADANPASGTSSPSKQDASTRTSREEDEG
jgi:type III secretory pathway lipoprotein EscJ